MNNCDNCADWLRYNDCARISEGDGLCDRWRPSYKILHKTLEAQLRDKDIIIQSLQSELTILEQDSIAKDRTIEKLITKGKK